MLKQWERDFLKERVQRKVKWMTNGRNCEPTLTEIAHEIYKDIEALDAAREQVNASLARTATLPQNDNYLELSPTVRSHL